MIEDQVLKQTTLVELISKAEQLTRESGPAVGAELYKRWIACNPVAELLYAAYFNYAISLASAGDHHGAINAARECIRIKPDFYAAYINLGRLLEDSGSLVEAIAQWSMLLNRLPDVNAEAVKQKLTALQQTGRVLEAHNSDDAAEAALWQALGIRPEQKEVIQHWTSLRMRQCKWPVMTPSEEAPANLLFANISPLSLAALTDDPAFQLARAWKYNKDSTKQADRDLKVSLRNAWRRSGHAGRKLRIGYVSSDFREHAVGFAMTDVLETHDRSSFEIHAYYCGIPRRDPTRERIEKAVDRWTDINSMTDAQAAARISADQIDILVDLNGYTKDARTGIFALCPAPVNVNWFGFPGTMGSPYHHYIIADDVIIPESHEIYYSEKVLRLPCYQPNDRKRQVAAKPTRRDEGLPDQAFVFCSLNGVQKITPTLFAQWMQILKATPDSVLWLLGEAAETNQRLKLYAQQAGVNPNRLIFSSKKPNPQHVARYALADLFLDNAPYGAHTTAADALWMGLPVLTVPGKSFASRVCASLVTAAGLGEMVCESESDYVARAIELGRNPKQVRSLSRKLSANRDECLLFDTPSLVANLEDLYKTMQRDFEAGLVPSPDLSNLEIYHEVGVELATRETPPFEHNDLKARYREMLGAYHETRPIKADSRLWRRLRDFTKKLRADANDTDIMEGVSEVDAAQTCSQPYHPPRISM
jgi:predicted O-linked N-acetylglucosamine transferase (SPINDLY family)